MITATHKIGECAIGGIVTVEVDNNANITIKCKDWNTKKVLLQKTFSFIQKSKIEIWLEDEVTTCYYAGKIMRSIYD